MAQGSRNVPALLESVSEGNPEAKKRLFSILYKELHAMAHQAMARENPGHMLQTTALVHETFLSLVKNEKARWKNRAHFYKAAAKAMRYILLDEAKKQKAAKRGAGRKVFPLDSIQVSVNGINIAKDPLKHLEELDNALDKLASRFERRCTIVELRFFAGLTIDQTAEVLGLSASTVKRDWEATRDWLRKEMNLSRRGAAEGD